MPAVLAPSSCLIWLALASGLATTVADPDFHWVGSHHHGLENTPVPAVVRPTSVPTLAKETAVSLPKVPKLSKMAVTTLGSSASASTTSVGGLGTSASASASSVGGLGMLHRPTLVASSSAADDDLPPPPPRSDAATDHPVLWNDQTGSAYCDIADCSADDDAGDT